MSAGSGGNSLCGEGRADRPGAGGSGVGRTPREGATPPPSPRPVLSHLVPSCPSPASRPFSLPQEVRVLRPFQSHGPLAPSPLPAPSPRTRDPIPRREEVGPGLTPPRPQAPTPRGISAPPCPGPASGSPASSPSATWTTRSSCGSTATPRIRGQNRGRRGWSRRARNIGKR